ncbi:hypothetical protein [Tannerella forsythia]|uniref:Transposase n=1 Tax=Tannerella forsythia TaxID=28112 RepID=A0A3P1XW96_TANFO|nr:hypothetical protein [Tannerella forsythia]RRD62207.1 hypothetical protein EII40_04630 [Tannerella forsythia]
MAKRRKLKKHISNLFGMLFSDVLICHYLLPETDKEKVVSLATRIGERNDEFICRAHHAPGTNRAEVKKYYQKLYTDLKTEWNALAEEIGRLTEALDKKA